MSRERIKYIAVSAARAFIWVCGIIAVSIITLSYVLDESTSTEVARVTSPDNSVDAVGVRYRPDGIMVGDRYYLLLLNRGELPYDVPTMIDWRGAIVLEAGGYEGIELKWLSSSVLQVSYRKAKIHEFKNHYHGGSPHNESFREYEIQLCPLSNSSL
jgi:hypothetical protein